MVFEVKAVTYHVFNHDDFRSDVFLHKEYLHESQTVHGHSNAEREKSRLHNG